jgi:hypothetical protein
MFSKNLLENESSFVLIGSLVSVCTSLVSHAALQDTNEITDSRAISKSPFVRGYQPEVSCSWFVPVSSSSYSIYVSHLGWDGIL